MKMTSILMGTVALVASAGVASAAAPTAVNHHGKAHQFKGVNRATTVLYSQQGTDSGIGIVSQNFESTFAQYDAAAADDFSVSGKGKITEVDANGVYFNGSGPAASEDVTFYKNKKGLPGKITAQFLGVTGADDFGSFTITLPGKGAKAKAGKTMWVSVVANLAFEVGGEWGWENQTTVVGNPAAWQNPGGGFATGCNSWEAETTCIPDGQGDHMFVLRGTTKG